MITEFAVPVSGDNATAFTRNGNQRANHLYAERIDDPLHASYFRLTPDTIGQPLPQRVAASLEIAFNRRLADCRPVEDQSQALDNLIAARSQLKQNDWSAAAEYAAIARAHGNPDTKTAALKVLRAAQNRAKKTPGFGTRRCN